MNVHELTLQNYAAGGGCPSACQPMLYLGTAGSYGNEQINVVLGEGWHGLTVKAVFQPCGVAVVVPDGGGVISVPWEATQSVVAYPNGRIVFEGVTDGRVLISTDIPYAVGSHSDTEGSNSQPPTPSEWEQFVDEVKGDADRAEKAAKDAEATLQDVKDAGGQAVTDIGAAKNSALDAIAKAGEEAAGSISADVQAANDAAAAAEQSAKDAAAELPKVQQAVQTAGTAAVDTVNNARDDAVEEIETANAHSPQINQDTGYWQTWDAETGEYVDTTIKAEGPQGNKGDTGNPGPQGETGATPQLTIGTVTTLDPDEDATVTITGTAEAPVLNFGIPKGEQGDGSTSGSDLPATTAADSGKAPTVNAAGTGYELAGPYAPLSAAIRPTASGNPVSITDSVEWPLLGLKVYGKSTQDGTPSPESPVPIVSAGDGSSIALTVSDGADQSQQLTVITPNGLPGIPVDSGGNYTDASGQRRWSDIIDYNNEKKYQYINEVVVDGTNVKFTSSGGGNEQYWNLPTNSAPNVIQIAKSYINKYFPSNVFTSNEKYGFIFTMPRNMAPYFETVEELNAFCVQKNTEGNPLTIMYVMDTPIETPLSEDEIAAYRALHTYDGATVVSTTEDVAGLDVRYLADAQKYIDNRLTAAESHIQEIAAAQLNAQTGG